MKIHTIRGDIDSKELGVTLMHEHIFAGKDGFKEEHRKMFMDYAELELRNAICHGTKTLVDVSGRRPRNIAWYEEIASRIPELNIICCTGYYLEHTLSKEMQAELREKDVDQIAESMVKEITIGIQGTDVKAGIIKVAADKPELTPFEKKNFVAAAKAQIETGVPICTHACAGAANQMKVLEEAGANLDHIYFCHIETELGFKGRTFMTSHIAEGRTKEEEAHYLANIARQGGSLLFNNFHLEQINPWPDIVFLIKYLCDKGFSDKVLISMDWNFHITDRGQIEVEDEGKYPDTVVRVPSFLFTNTVPSLLKAGFTEDDIEQFLVRNPMQIFGT